MLRRVWVQTVVVARKFLVAGSSDDEFKTISISLRSFGTVQRTTLAASSFTDPGTIGVVVVRPEKVTIRLLERLVDQETRVPLALVIDELKVASRLIQNARVFIYQAESSYDFSVFGRLAIAERWLENERLARLVVYEAEQNSLSDRECEVLAASIAGRTREELCTELGVTENTLKGQVRILLARTHSKSLEALVNQVLRNALTPPARQR